MFLDLQNLPLMKGYTFWTHFTELIHKSCWKDAGHVFQQVAESTTQPQVPQVAVSKWSFASLLPGHSKAMVIDVFFLGPQLQVFIAEHETNTFVKTTSFLVFRNQCPQVPFPPCKGSCLSKCHFWQWTHLGSTKLLCLFLLPGMLQASEREIFLGAVRQGQEEIRWFVICFWKWKQLYFYMCPVRFNAIHIKTYNESILDTTNSKIDNFFTIMKFWARTAHSLLPFRPCLARKWSSVRRQAFSRNSTRFLNASQEKKPLAHEILVV